MLSPFAAPVPEDPVHARTADVLVTGAGGFIGGHRGRRPASQGHHVRAVDRKPLDQWYQCFADADNHSDL
jgi:nucleoside-diphosphate-sugar epimerase